MGRRLKRAEVVHHVNEQKADNRRENLMVFAGDAGHVAYHAGKAARPVFDGRTLPCAAPATPNTGPAVVSKILRVAGVKWRELAWFQADLKSVTADGIARLKASIVRNGWVAVLHVWEDVASGKMWVLDGHQRKRALAELEGEGYRLPDEVPGVFLDCKDAKEAAELVLVYSSRAGEIHEEQLVDFVKEHGLDVGALVQELTLDRLDLENVKREHFDVDGALRTFEGAVRDSRPARRFSILTVKDPRQTAVAVAVLNRLGVGLDIEEGADASAAADS